MTGDGLTVSFLLNMDIQLYYEKSGKGDPLILLHGNGDSHAFFAGQIPALSARFTVYAVDTRGHGQSPLGEKPFTLTQFADDLLHFMDGQGIDRAHIVGASDGANIAMLFALRCPDRVRSLVLNSGNLDPSGLLPSFLAEIRGRYAEICALDSEGMRHETGLLRLMIEEPHIPPEAFSVIRVPTLVIVGDDDLISAEHTRLIADSIPNASLAVLPGTHSVAQEDPIAFNAALLSFYDSAGF